MADDRIIHKRSGISQEVPSPDQLEFGELALNYADGRLFAKLLNGTISDLTGLPESNNTIYVSLSGDDNNNGKEPGSPKRTIKAALNAAEPNTTIDIAAGVYVEKTPLILPQFVTVHGVDQRITTVRPETPTNDVFWVSNSCYITGLAVRGHQKPSFCVAFPGVVETGTSQGAGPGSNTIILGTNSVSGPGLENYYREMRITLKSGTGAGQSRNIVTYNVETRRANVDVNWTTSPDTSSVYEIDIEIPALPAPSRRYSQHITASPYLYNLASVTADIKIADATNSVAIGSGTKTFTVPTGLSLNTNQYIRAYHNATNYMIGKITSYSGASLQIDVTKAVGRGTFNKWELLIVCGAGMEIDGFKASGLRSFVSAQFTQFNSGGDGVVMKNMGYAQLVSIYGICCEDAFLAESGGTASMGNCNVNFGNRGLVANGVGPLLMTGKSGFVYNQTKCERDTKLIVDSLAQDLLFTGQTQSTFAGIQYWNQEAGNLEVPPNQLAATVGAIQEAGVIAATFVSTTAEKNFVTAAFNKVADIITNGTTGITDQIIPNTLTASATPAVIAANTALQTNKGSKTTSGSIIKLTLDWIQLNHPDLFAESATMDRCATDLGFIIDCVSFDLVYNADPSYVAPSNRQTIQAGVYYYGYTNVSAVGDEIPQTVAAYEHLKALAAYVITGTAVPSSLRYQNSVSQDTSGSPGIAAQSATTNTNITLITSIINNGPPAASTLTPISLTRTTDSNVVNAATLLKANRDFIGAEVIAYLNSVFGYDNQTGFTVRVSNISPVIDIRFNITADTKPYVGLVMEIEGETTLDIQLGPGYQVGDVIKVSYDASNFFIGTITSWDPVTETAVIAVSSSTGSGTYFNWNTIINGQTAPNGTPGRFTQNINLPVTGTVTVPGLDTSLVIPKYRTIIAADTVGDITTLDLDERITGSLTINGVQYPNGLPKNTNVKFYQKSALSASGQTFEFVGSGTSVAVALPRNGGDIIQANETVSSNGGIVYFTSTDQFGNFRIGEDLVINFNTGTLSGRTFTRSLFAQITPFVLALDS
jgi:hypothetical protein